MKEFLEGLFYFLVIVAVILGVLYFIGYNLPEWNGWTDYTAPRN
jgi:hypothetical protein